MKLVRLFCVCCILLVNIGCTKQEKNIQEPLNSTVNTVSKNNNGIVNTVSKNNTGSRLVSRRIILKAEDTKGVTDITEFFREYLKNKSDEYISSINFISFHQNDSTEEKLEHLGDLKMFPNLTDLIVSSNLTSVDIEGLPSTLERLDLSHNKIVSFNAETLPQGLVVLYLRKNNLSSFNVEVFPDNLLWLDLSRNNLSYIDVGSLPQSLQSLDLSQNNFSSFDIALLPEKVDTLDLSYNPIEGPFNIENRKGIRVLLNNNPNRPSVAPKEDVYIKDMFRHWTSFPANYSEEEKEEEIENMVNNYLSEFIGYESIFESYDTLELLDSIARYLE